MDMTKCTKPFIPICNLEFSNVSDQWSAFIINSKLLDEVLLEKHIELNTSKTKNIQDLPIILHIQHYVTSTNPPCMELLTAFYSSLTKLTYLFWYQLALNIKGQVYEQVNGEGDEEEEEAIICTKITQLHSL